MTGRRAEQCTSRLARAAGVKPPPVVAVPVLGNGRGHQGRLDGALAITESRDGEPTIYIAQAAAEALPDTALDYLLAHELGHVVAWRRPTYRSSLRIKELLMFGPGATAALLAVAEAIAVATSTATVPRSALILFAAWPVLLVLGQMGRMAVQRREELAADRWAGQLLGTVVGLEACAQWTAQHAAPRRRQHLGEWLLTGTHPKYSTRLAAMRKVVSGGPPHSAPR